MTEEASFCKLSHIVNVNNETNVVLQMSVPFIGKFQLLNVILDQFVVCKFIIHYYTKFTVHKLIQNCIQKLAEIKKKNFL